MTCVKIKQVTRVKNEGEQEKKTGLYVKKY